MTLDIVVKANTTFDALAEALSNRTGVPLRLITLVWTNRSNNTNSSSNVLMVVSFGSYNISSVAAVSAAESISFVLAATEVRPPSTKQNTASGGAGLPLGAIVGGGAGGLVVLILAVFIVQKRRRAAASRGYRFDDDAVMLHELHFGTLDELLRQDVGEDTHTRVEI